MSTPSPYAGHKLLIANRGEIAVRIIRTAKELGLSTIAIYTPSDTLSPHVSMADEAIALPADESGKNLGDNEAKSYLAAASIVSICLANGVTLLHPGYGFLSENADFASRLIEAGITWLGPRPEVIRMMGLKHEARVAAAQAGVPVVPGSAGLLGTAADALKEAARIGFPVILKATAGGGGMGMVVCESEEDLQAQFLSTQQRSKNLFSADGLFIERYFSAARHIEIQVFGNGLGDVVHMNERECSVQRRHQKIIEESPSPFVESYPGLKERMCDAAVNLCRTVKYSSAGTVEFLVDEATGDFYFLEMNTRIQVEHPVTEAIHPGLDLVKLMIKQGIAERQATGPVNGLGTSEPEMQQATYDTLRLLGQDLYAYAIEGRVYAENPSQGFMPSPGLLQCVELNSHRFDWLRIETWVSTGLLVTPFFDGLLAKIIVTGRSRAEAIARFEQALDMTKIYGPPNNMEYMKLIAGTQIFREGRATTNFLADFVFKPCAFTVISAGIESTVQDLPGRTLGLGIPRAGPMDSLALSAGNILVDNPPTMEGLEIVILPSIGFELEFSVAAVIAVTGKKVTVKVNDATTDMWTKITIPQTGRLRLEVDPETETSDAGFRVYVCLRGGLPSVPPYLGSKSTSMGLGGYQGRALLAGDQLSLGSCNPGAKDDLSTSSLARALVPKYSSEWIVYVLPGPQDDEDFIASDGINAFYSTKWRVSFASNRLGIRLESSEKIQWARANGGEGGSHPSNILDNGYASGSININGDTPVILTRDGPDMGGYVSLCTVASGDMWKLGQVQPGNTIQFRRISWRSCIRLNETAQNWIASVRSCLQDPSVQYDEETPWAVDIQDTPHSSILHEAGDSAILVEFGTMNLDLDIRARIHAFQSILTTNIPVGLTLLAPCVRSIMCHFDPTIVTQANFLLSLTAAQKTLPSSVTDMRFSGRKITFPIVLDDPWNQEALSRYMKTTRQKAVYLPSNIEYLARNNGLEGGAEEALKRLIGTDWLVLGVGFYLGCPFLVPIDPRCRLIGQKMNPSRTFTPRGAIGIAGPVAAIYPVESPGGYQLYGRTLPTWQTWGKGVDFSPAKPWLLQPFDQIHFESVSANQYTELEKDFDAGLYAFKIEQMTFSMEEYTKFVDSISDEVMAFRSRQQICSSVEDEQEREYLRELDVEKKARIDSLKSEEREQEKIRRLLTRSPGFADPGSVTINASLFASVWRINVQPGDVIQAADDVLLILEAMKMEIPIRGGERNVGKTIKQLGKGVAEGASVSPGDVLFVLL
ncbi:allophanate hydrolase subunit 2-domain-containing protein [Lyophyllum atratum]|nr:allophanate hydrolase subunit 2-domain-containing protein [Lyophyllum atratum]